MIPSPFLRKVITAMETIAPLHLAETSWDNVGLLVEAPYPKETNQGVFLTIDLTPSVLEEALALGNIGVIIAYHPTLFRPWKNLAWTTNPTDPEAVKKKMLMQLVAQGISLYSPHTALDSTFEGINDWLASGLPNIQSIRPILPTATCTTDRPEGQGRLVTFTYPCDLATLVKAVKSHLNLNSVRIARSPRNHLIQTVAICAGSGGSLFSQTSKADVFWTGELSHHEVLRYLPSSHVILCEHTNTERGYLTNQLKPKLESEFGLTSVYVSEVDQEPLKIV